MNCQPKLVLSHLLSKVKVKVTFRLTVNQSVSLDVEPHLGLMTRYLLLFDSYGLFVCVTPSLTRGRVCHLYMLLALSSAVFSGPSPLRLATIFYCFRFETFLLVASYHSQGHGGGIRPRLHTGFPLACQMYSVYSPGMDPTENTVSNNSSIVLDVFTDPFSRNGRLLIRVLHINVSTRYNMLNNEQ
jgi:hypothetical protein